MQVFIFMCLIFSYFIILYQKLISPLLPKSCIFVPSCSEYAIELLKSKKFNILKTVFLILKRFFKCQNLFGKAFIKHDDV